MAGLESPGFLSFRRTLTLLVVLVVIPSAGLSGFGVLAIVNEQAAVEKRMERLWRTQVHDAQRRIDQAWQATVVTAGPRGLVLTSNGLSLCRSGFRVHEGEVTADDATLASAVLGILPSPDLIPETPIMFSAGAPARARLLAAAHRGDAIVGCEVELEAIDAILARGGVDEGTRLRLVAAQPEVGGVISRLVSGVTEARAAALGQQRELAAVALPSPAQDFKVAAFATGPDPVAYASRRNRIVYAILLILALVALVVGIVSTARTLYREARLSRLKTDFVSLVSHELRTPLTSIRLFIEMLARGQVRDPEEMKTVLQLLHKETTRLSNFGDAVLDWSRIESGSKRYALRPTSADDVVEAGVAPFRTQRMGQEMDFRVEVQEGLPLVLADREAIGGALLNVLQNAYKYTPSKDKRIRLRAFIRDEELNLEVEDNGPGIPPREHRKIFERFYRADDLLTRASEGTGLGLAIAQRIVTAHGGRITVDSATGEGSRFCIHLPVADGA